MGVREVKDRGLKKRFQAYASANGRFKHLGYYETKLEASSVRDDFVKKHFKEFGVLNGASEAKESQGFSL